MKRILMAASVMLSLGTVLFSNSSIAQDGWVRPGTLEPLDPSYVEENCLDVVPPDCAIFYQNGTPIETLTSKPTEG